MSKKCSTLLIILLFCQLAYSQNSTESKLKFEVTKTAFPYCFESENWNDKFEPDAHSLGYDLIDMKIDTGAVSGMIRQAINPKFYKQLNSKAWVVVTKLTSYGEIVSLSFKFKNNLHLDEDELQNLAGQIKKSVRWQLYFDKEVDDLFYLELSFSGPKL